MSEQRSHVYKWFIELDDGEIEQWLRSQALAGWHLKGFRMPCRFTFVRGEPSDEVYRFDSFAPWKRSAEYDQLCQDAGWELVFYWWGSYCWRKPAADGQPNEIYTDTPSKIARQQRLLMYFGLTGLLLVFNLLGSRDRQMDMLRMVLTGVQAIMLLPMSYLIWRTLSRLRRLRRQAL